jgi:diguanylate cyclase (GGDEF)-like protein
MKFRRTPDVKKDPTALLRVFATSAVLSIVVIIWLAGYGLTGVLQRFVLRDAEEDAIKVSMALLAEERPNIVTRNADGSSTLTVTPQSLPRLDRDLRIFLAPFDIVKIKIYSADSRIVYSTEAKLIGRIDEGNVRLNNALAGNYDSKLEKKEEVKDLANEVKFNVDVVETYIPIRDDNGKVIGSFEVYLDVTQYRKETRAAVNLFLGLLALILVAVEIVSFLFIRKGTQDVKTFQEILRKQTLTDPLTGIFNKRHIALVAQKEFARAARRKKKGVEVNLGILMLDVDRFKEVNDSYGHLAGDTVLNEIAERITSSLRNYDTVGRFGGEEFLVVLPATDLEQSRVVAEKIWGLIRETPFILNGEPVTVTASVGVSSLQNGDADYTEIIKRADEALYRAKSAGRDRIIS